MKHDVLERKIKSTIQVTGLENNKNLKDWLMQLEHSYHFSSGIQVYFQRMSIHLENKSAFLVRQFILFTRVGSLPPLHPFPAARLVFSVVCNLKQNRN